MPRNSKKAAEPVVPDTQVDLGGLSGDNLQKELDARIGRPPAEALAQATAAKIGTLQLQMDSLSSTLSATTFLDDDDDLGKGAGALPPGHVSSEDSNRAATRKSEKEWGDALVNKALHEDTEPDFKTIELRCRVDLPDTTSSARTKLVEFAVFPGFTEVEPCDLPGIKSSLEYMQQVYRINVEDHAFFEATKDKFHKYFLCKMSVALLTDIWWWCWVDRYGTNDMRGDKDKVFSRIASSFVALHNEVPTGYRDIFFNTQSYPYLVTQSVYCAFCNVFPDSVPSFAYEDFKVWLTNLITEWMTGVTPLPGLWRHWDTVRLEPPPNSLLRSLAKVEVANATRAASAVASSRLNSAKSNASHQTSTLNTPPASARRIQYVDSHKKPAVHPDAPYHCKSVLFNLQGHTPLFAHYLRTQGMNDGTDDAIYIHRTQLQETGTPSV